MMKMEIPWVMFFIGEANFRETEGSKPMSIKWELNEPLPNYLWKESAKMSMDN
jgi:hypothetical protein